MASPSPTTQTCCQRSSALGAQYVSKPYVFRLHLRSHDAAHDVNWMKGLVSCLIGHKKRNFVSIFMHDYCKKKSDFMEGKSFLPLSHARLSGKRLSQYVIFKSHGTCCCYVIPFMCCRCGSSCSSALLFGGAFVMLLMSSWWWKPLQGSGTLLCSQVYTVNAFTFCSVSGFASRN